MSQGNGRVLFGPPCPLRGARGLADRIETRRHGKALHCRNPPVGDVWARFYGGSCRQSGACAPAPLFYSLFKALSIPAVCTLGMVAAPGRCAGVGVIGAVEKAVIVLHSYYRAGTSAIGLI